MPEDHRKRPRRRGRTLDQAIFEATLAELSESGYPGLTMERIAERARASKASLYRRWPSRVELVMDAVYDSLPDPAKTPDCGSLRQDLLASLRHTAQILVGPRGEALRGVLSDVVRDPGRTAEVRSRSQRGTLRTVEEIVRRAVERGEVDERNITPRRLEAGHALLRQHFLIYGAPLPEELLVEIVDEVMLPLLTG